MLYLSTMLLGALGGGFFARARGGNRFDIAQYAAVFGVMGFIIGILATIIVARATTG